MLISQLTQAKELLLSLLVNSFKARDDRLQVLLSVKHVCKGGLPAIVFTDSGEGIQGVLHTASLPILVKKAFLVRILLHLLSIESF